MSEHLDLIVDSILEERCALMLGPKVAVNSQGVPIQTDLPRYFEEETDLEIEKDTDNLILFKSRKSKSFFYTELKRYYQKCKPLDNVHKKLTQIPFHIILSTTPDTMLKQCFEQYGMEYEFHYYNKKQNPSEIKKTPGRDCPLLYNLFGCITDEDSLIVTHDDLFEFLFCILGEQRLPRELKRCVQRTKIFVFLGFDFEKWYLQLILRLFELHRDAMPIASQSGVQIKEQTKAFYINNFEMEFIDTDVQTFVDELHKKFETQGHLREIKPLEEKPITAEIKKLIAGDNIEDALEKLEDYLEENSSDLVNAVIQQSGMYSNLKRKMNRSTISEAEANLQMNKIRGALIDIADDLKNL